MTELLCHEESYAIMEACFQVYKNKGCGSLRGSQNCFEIELVYLVCFVG